MFQVLEVSVNIASSAVPFSKVSIHKPQEAIGSENKNRTRISFSLSLPAKRKIREELQLKGPDTRRCMSSSSSSSSRQTCEGAKNERVDERELQQYKLLRQDSHGEAHEISASARSISISPKWKDKVSLGADVAHRSMYPALDDDVRARDYKLASRDAAATRNPISLDISPSSSLSFLDSP